MISNTFTAVDQVSRGITIGGLVTLSLSGTWVATVVLERSLDGGSNFNVVETFTKNHEAHVRGAGEVFRLRVTNFDSGTVAYFLGQPPA